MLRVLQIGAIAIALAASTLFAFDLDRFLVPKELVLHVVAFIAGALVLRRLHQTKIDKLLLAYLALGVLSAALAQNRWLGFRALAVSASSVVLFWVARSLRERGIERPVLAAAAATVLTAAITSLLETYGVRTMFFATTRIPGGTLGNRNFVAHVAAIGMPLLIMIAMRAERASRHLLASGAAALTAAALVITRSRAAWLASATSMLVCFAVMLSAPAFRRSGRAWGRLAIVLALAGAASAGALLLPNSLNWASDNPYLESIHGMANYAEGSGHGRLIQYSRSAIVAIKHPLLGVGPGNWPVAYPKQVLHHSDPSMNPSEGGMTYNPWPSSDWVAFLCERGIAATALLGIVFVMMFARAFGRAATATDADDALRSAALAGVIVAACVSGAFDAVLLLPVPSFVTWIALGALWTPPMLEGVAPPRLATIAIVAVLLLSLAGAVRSASQLIAMEVYSTKGDRASLEWASRIDPGNFRLQLRLARGGGRSSRCAHAVAARNLFPNSDAAIGLARGCR